MRLAANRVPATAHQEIEVGAPVCLLHVVNI
jgi:hypothetical protein